MSEFKENNKMNEVISDNGTRIYQENGKIIQETTYNGEVFKWVLSKMFDSETIAAYYEALKKPKPVVAVKDNPSKYLQL